MQGPRANRHSLEGPKNLCVVPKYGAQSEIALGLCFAIIELGLVSNWKVCVRGRKGKRACGRKSAEKASFLALQRTPLSPPRGPARLFQTPKMLRNLE